MSVACNNFNADLGERIKSARKAAGKTQQQVADSLGVHVNHIQRFEYGKHRLSVRDACRIADALGVTLPALLTGIDWQLSSEKWRESSQSMHRRAQKAESEASSLRQQIEKLTSAGYVLVPIEPPADMLLSMAIRYDHGLGVQGYYDQPIFGAENVGHERRMAATMTTMSQLYEEIVGKGFYRPVAAEREEEVAR